MSTHVLRNVGSLVKLSHTIFALPFALAAVLLAAPYGAVTWERVLLIVLCIAAARTAAMAFNRLVDRDIDAKNPRTADRELPRGALSVGFVRALVLGSSLAFVAFAALLGRLPLLLSPLALGLALGYSYVKRFSSLCHLVLGAAIAFAPGGGVPRREHPFDFGQIVTFRRGVAAEHALGTRRVSIERGAKLHSGQGCAARDGIFIVKSAI